MYYKKKFFHLRKCDDYVSDVLIRKIKLNIATIG